MNRGSMASVITVIYTAHTKTEAENEIHRLDHCIFMNKKEFIPHDYGDYDDGDGDGDDDDGGGGGDDDDDDDDGDDDGDDDDDDDDDDYEDDDDDDDGS